MENRYNKLVEKSLSKGSVDPEDIRWILTEKSVELLQLLSAVYQVRYRYFENKVKINILNNVQSGNCTEDCKYCAQSKESENTIDTYPMKADDEIIEGARQAYETGAFRYCMVFSGRGLGKNRIEKICSVVKKIKAQYRMELCVSAGFLSDDDAQELVKAGVNRYNHNLNTSSSYYSKICTSHDYGKRVDTIKTARKSGLDVCSGVIIGMGETVDDIIKMTDELRQVGAKSIPVNFFIPIKGHRIPEFKPLDPQYCLKVLSAFRFALPEAEIRASAGREYHLRSLQALCLYAVNSVFAKGYLTTGGDSVDSTKQMIEDSGFVVEEIE